MLTRFHFKQMSFKRVSSSVIVAIVLLVSLILAEIFLPYRPLPKEAVDSVVAMFRSFEANLTQNTQGTKYLDFRVHGVQPIGRATQLVLLSYEMVNTHPVDASSNSCLEIRFVTKRWISGVSSYATSMKCVNTSVQRALTLELVGAEQDGYYVVGGVVSDTKVIAVRVTWRDKAETVIPVIKNSFLTMRPNSTGILYVVGLDAQSHAVARTLAYDPTIKFSLQDYAKVQQIPVDDGIILLGTFSQTSPYSLECIELLYLTAENARKFLANEAALTGQQACIIEPDANQILGPLASAVGIGDTVIGGRILSNAVVRVHIHWSDGVDQIVPVVDGFYFAHRPSTSASATSFTALDAQGNVLAQQP
jgi:hypothetical protein